MAHQASAARRMHRMISPSTGRDPAPRAVPTTPSRTYPASFPTAKKGLPLPTVSVSTPQGTQHPCVDRLLSEVRRCAVPAGPWERACVGEAADCLKQTVPTPPPPGVLHISGARHAPGPWL